MNQLVKFNQRGRRVDDDAKEFAFGIIIGERNDWRYSFTIVNEKKKGVRCINMNEWKIFDIDLEAYFVREKILLSYCTPDGSLHSFETGGRTIPDSPNLRITAIINFLEAVFRYFHKLSCFESIEEVIEKREQLEKEGKVYESKRYNHQYMSTS
jgi:hypothetical protein